MITVLDGKFWFNGERQEHVIGRSSFKLSNILTYHWTGQGDKYGLGHAERWIEHNQRIFGEHVVLRVFLETAGWNPCSDCMFGSEPRDQGFWERDRLRDHRREQDMHPVGAQALEWLFKTSQETGVALELIIDATLKHDDIPKGEIDHVIRQVGIEMGVLNARFPRSLVVPSMRNEWNAHNQSGHTLHDVNMWAIRWDRDEYWQGAAKIVDGGGANSFEFEVGPEDGKYRAGMIHPERDEGWERFPSQAELDRLKGDARGMPVGFTESMYYVEPEDRERAQRWYRASGWTTDWGKYRQFMEHAIPLVDYFIVHDEKGAQTDPDWPRPETRVEAWARGYFGTGPGPEPPPTLPPPEENDLKIVYGSNFVSVQLPNGPIVVEVPEGSDHFYREEFLLRLDHEFDVFGVDCFMGHDRGDVYEATCEIWSDEDPSKVEHARDFLYRRIDEDTAPGGAGSTYQLLAEPLGTHALKIWLEFRVGGPNEAVNQDHPSHDKWRGVFDWNVVLIGRRA